jgi:hypothetical protein
LERLADRLTKQPVFTAEPMKNIHQPAKTKHLLHFWVEPYVRTGL